MGRATLWVDQVCFHLVQDYFGAPTADLSGVREVIRPIVDTSLWDGSQPAVAPGTAVIGFGGMRVPGRGETTARYCSWLLAAVLPVLVDHVGLDVVHVIGAHPDMADLVPSAWRHHPAIQLRPGLGRSGYAAVVRRAEHLILAPGLGAIHECAAARCCPLFQPGFNMSMVLQCHALAQTGYPYLAPWPDLPAMVRSLRGVPESAGLRRVAQLIDHTIRCSDPAGVKPGGGRGRVSRARDTRPGSRCRAGQVFPTDETVWHGIFRR